MKICFITTIICDKIEDGDNPCIFEINENYDYFLFTNNDINSYKDTSWKVIKINDKYIENLESNVMKSRFMKFMGWKYISEEMGLNYDMIVYCDGLFFPRNEVIGWKRIFDNFETHDIVQQIHSRNAYEECNAIVKAKKDTKKRMDNMKQFLINENMPKKFIMTENNTFAYDPNNKKITNAFEFFWMNYLKNITHRDQPLWSYVLWKKDIKVNINNKLTRLIKRSNNKAGFNSHKYV